MFPASSTVLSQYLLNERLASCLLPPRRNKNREGQVTCPIPDIAKMCSSEFDPGGSASESAFSSTLVPLGPCTPRDPVPKPPAWLQPERLASSQRPGQWSAECRDAGLRVSVPGSARPCPQLLCARDSQRTGILPFVPTNFSDLCFPFSKRNLGRGGDRQKSPLVLGDQRLLKSLCLCWCREKPPSSESY